MKMTQHATLRSQQRAIPMMLVDLVIGFGIGVPAGDGTTKYFFDRASRKEVKRYAGQAVCAIEEHLDIYAVVGPQGEVITVAHRIDRIKRH